MFTIPNLVSDRPPVLSVLFIALNVMLSFVLIGPVIGLTVASFFYDGNLLKELESISPKPELVTPLLIMQAVVTAVALIAFPIIHITKIEHKSLRPFFPTQSQTFKILLLLVIIGFTFPIAISPLVEWNLNLKFPEFMSGFERWAMHEEDRLAKLTKMLTNFDSPLELIVGLLVIAILPAFGEELVFRGMIQGELWRSTRNIHIAIWVSAAVFSAIHIQFYGFVPRMLLGALFGYLYYWSGNLWIPMFSHFFNNAFAVIMVYLNNTKVTNVNLEDGESFPLQSVLAAAVITTGVLYYIWKHYRDLPARPNEQSI